MAGGPDLDIGHLSQRSISHRYLLGRRERWLLYNDAWRPILGDKHPWALGRPAREVWPEIWSAIEPLFDTVRDTGQAIWRGDE
jgi:hypothetical protein